MQPGHFTKDADPAGKQEIREHHRDSPSHLTMQLLQPKIPDRLIQVMTS